MKFIFWIIISFLTSCKLYSYVYGIEKPPQNEDFDYYDKNFEINNQLLMKQTNLKFNGFYLPKTDYDKNLDLKVKKFFKTGLITKSTYLRGTKLEYISEDMNNKQYYFGFIKFIHNDELEYEFKANHMNKKKTGIKGKYIIFENYLLDINYENSDTIRYDFYPFVKSALYPKI